MRERLTLQPIGSTRSPITVRDYSVPGSIVFERKLGEGLPATGDTHSTPFYAGVSKESAIALRDFLLARYPVEETFEPRTVLDRDGDLWVETEPDRFQIVSTLDGEPIPGKTSLDAIDRNYGIDDGGTFEPRTIVDGQGDVWVEVAPEAFLMAGYEDAPGSDRRSIDYVASTYGIDDTETPKADEVRAGDVRVMRNPRSTTGSPLPLWDGTRVEVLRVVSDSYELRAVDGRPDGMTREFFWHVGGVDLVKEEEPLAGWERELLALAPAPAFQVGDRVRVTGDTGSAHGLRPFTRGKIVEAWSGTFVIEDDGTNCPDFRFHELGRRYVAADEIQKLTGPDAVIYDEGYLKPAPAFAPGDRVRIVGGPYQGDSAAPGGTGTVIAVDGGDCRGLFRVETDERGGYSGQTLGFEADEIAPLREAGDPTGSVVFVTGDSDDWSHDFAPGTAVRITGDDYEEDGSYLVEPLKDSLRVGREDGDYVGANDLALESGREQTFPTGALVRVTNDGSDEELRHFLEVGSIARVTGWTDLSTEPGSGYDETYTVEGVDDNGKDGLVQSVAPGSIAPIEKGTRLRVVGNSNPRHFLPANSIVEARGSGRVSTSVYVKGSDLMTDGGAPREQYVSFEDLAPANDEEPAFSVGDYVRHITGNEGRVVRLLDEFGAEVEWLAGPSLVGVTCQANLSNLTKVDEPAPRVVLGADPSVVDWSECLKPGPMIVLPDEEIRVSEAPNYCGVCRTAPCALGI